MQKKAIRIISGARFNDHTAPLFFDLNILPFTYLIEQAKLKFMHSVKFEYCPKSYLDVFKKVDVDNLVYDLRYPSEFEVPRVKLELFKRIPLYSLPVEWNNCGDLRFYSNSTTFNIELYSYLCKKFMTDNGLIGEPV
jgi:hypothetical protein